MNRTSVALRMAVLLLLAATLAFAGQIDPALQDVLNQSSPQDTIPCMFMMTSQFDLSQLNLEGLDRLVKRATVIAALENHAGITQPSILVLGHRPSR